MNRRTFLLRGSAGLAAAGLMPSLLPSCIKDKDPLRDFGLITNVVRRSIGEDHRSTMEALAEMGYRYLEFGGTYGEEAESLLVFMKEVGLKPLAGGTSMSGLQGDDLYRQIDACHDMDKQYLVCYWPWMGDGQQLDRAEVDQAIEQCNRMAGICKQQGLGFAWHNHDQEFQAMGDRVIYDYILEHTGEEVNMEVDLYWVHKGGADVREYFKKYPGRFPLVHIKDSFNSAERESFACVGDGIIDFEDLLSYREVGGFKHLIVENDQPPADELGCARSSIDHLKSLRF